MFELSSRLLEVKRREERANAGKDDDLDGHIEDFHVDLPPSLDDIEDDVAPPPMDEEENGGGGGDDL